MTRTTCPYCGVGCGIIATADVSGGVSVSGDTDHPANAGRLCSKGAALAETLSLDGRLLQPEIDGARVSWDMALDHVATRFASTIAEHGPDSVALYVSGQLLTEDYYAANKFAKGFLGTANIDSNSRLCMASAVAGHRRAFGEDLVPGIYADLELADLIILVGSNTAWCHPVLYQRIAAARAARPEMRLVVIDPRRTATCEGADLHLPLRPGTDVALFNGLLAHLDRDGVRPPGPIPGMDEALWAAHGATVAATAKFCGLAEDALEKFYALFAATPRTVTMFSQGVNQSSAGTDKVNAIINVHLLTGRIGTPGAGPFSVTGQPNAMGGREVGALSNMLAAHLEWDRPGDADRLRRFWDAPNLAPRPGLKAVDLFDAIADKKVRAVWIMATNPAVSLPDAGKVRRALSACDFVVVSDCVRETDTMDLAHVRLPALGWGEKDGTVTNSERMISRQRAFLPAPGDTRADWWIIAEVARRMGFSAAFNWSGPADIWREHAALSGFENNVERVFDISALASLSNAEYETLIPTRWPCAAGRPARERLCGGGAGKMIATHHRAPAHPLTKAENLVLLSGRTRDQWHTMTRTGKTSRLMAHAPEPVLTIHPDDAPAVANGGLAEITSAWGSSVLRIRHDPGVGRGAVFAPMHWTDRFCRSATINRTINPATDPISGQPELKHTPVRVRPYEADWHGFLLARRNFGVELADWSALVLVGEGIWRHEFAGSGSPEAAYDRLWATVGGAEPWLALRDPACGLFRGALLRDGGLQAALFVAPDPTLLPPRDWLVSLFGERDLPPSVRRAILAGRLAGGPPAEPPLCVCHGIGETAIRESVHAGCRTVEAIGRATRAGTGCGSCRPEISTLLAGIPAQVLETA